MDKTRHLALARLALAQGLVTLEGYSQAVIRLRHLGEHPTLEELWEGLVPPAQMAQLRAAAEMGEGETVAPLGASPPPESLEGAPVETSVKGPERVSTAATNRTVLPEYLPPDSNPEAPFAIPESRYELREVLGRGGMGFVQSAWDKALRREVAIKMLRKERQSDPIAQEVFWREARITGRLEHPQIVPVHDIGQLPGGELYYTMKRVRGTDLSRIIAALARGRDQAIVERYTLYRLISIFVQACQGIAYAHAQGVLHRDIKPANIMVGDFGEVLVLDWGLALRPSRMTAAERKRQSGRAIGTPGYMSPEQAAGDLDRMGPASDVFSLGAVLYELLTLTPILPQDEPRAVIRRLAREPIEPPRRRAPDRQIPGALEALCLWALEKKPEDRPRSAAELAEELSAFLEGSKERARRREEADKRVAQGRAAQARYEDLHIRARQARMEAAALAESTDPFAPLEQKRLLWQKEDQARALEAEERSAFGEAVRALFQALSHDPDHRPSRAALADLYLTRLLAIEAEHGSREEAEMMRQLAATYDDGRLAVMLRGNGTVSFRTNPEGAQATLYRYEEEDRVLKPHFLEELGPTPIEQKNLPMGSYMVLFRQRGLAAAAVPFRVGRCESPEILARLYPAAKVLPGFAYVPGGPFLAYGSPSGRPLELQELPDFCLQIFPVTLGEYLVFLEDIGPLEGQKRLPRGWGEIPPIRFSSGRFVIDEGAGLRLSSQAPLLPEQIVQLPVTSIRHEDATAYAAWRSAREGLPLRLPRSLEWEKGARGTDGRSYPWGWYFDPTFCKHRDSKQEGPEPVGSFPADESPYGIRDCAGGVAEWMEDGPHPERCYVRGGSWDSGAETCHLAHRTSLSPSGRFRGVGFRLAYSL